MKFNKHQCRACGKDHSKQSKDWRRKNNCRPWPTPDPAHLPKKSWKAPKAGMICGDCRQIKHKVTRVATSLQKKSSKQTAKLREQSKKLSKTKVKLKVAREQVKKLENVSARKPETTSDFAAFCKEKRVRFSPPSSCSSWFCAELAALPSPPHTRTHGARVPLFDGTVPT